MLFLFIKWQHPNSHRNWWSGMSTENIWNNTAEQQRVFIWVLVKNNRSLNRTFSAKPALLKGRYCSLWSVCLLNYKILYSTLNAETSSDLWHAHLWGLFFPRYKHFHWIIHLAIRNFIGTYYTAIEALWFSTWWLLTITHLLFLQFPFWSVSRRSSSDARRVLNFYYTNTGMNP